jgi:hypothetical protein
VKQRIPLAYPVLRDGWGRDLRHPRPFRWWAQFTTGATQAYDADSTVSIISFASEE